MASRAPGVLAGLIAILVSIHVFAGDTDSPFFQTSIGRFYPIYAAFFSATCSIYQEGHPFYAERDGKRFDVNSIQNKISNLHGDFRVEQVSNPNTKSPLVATFDLTSSSGEKFQLRVDAIGKVYIFNTDGEVILSNAKSSRPCEKKENQVVELSIYHRDGTRMSVTDITQTNVD